MENNKSDIKNLYELTIADLKALVDFSRTQMIEFTDTSKRPWDWTDKQFSEGFEYWSNVNNECRIAIHHRVLTIFKKPQA